MELRPGAELPNSSTARASLLFGREGSLGEILASPLQTAPVGF